MKMSKSLKANPYFIWLLGIDSFNFRRESGIEIALRYLKKFDYFIPCFYDFVKKHQPQEHI